LGRRHRTAARPVKQWNPYTDQHTEPRNGLVSERGQIGYAHVTETRRGRHNEGYVINDWGALGEVIRFEELHELEP
jgi:hypothetical protein